MKRGELERGKKKGCLLAFLIVWAVFMVKVISVLDLNFGEIWDRMKSGDITGFAYLWLVVFLVLVCCFVLWRIIPKGYFRKKQPDTAAVPVDKWAVIIPTHEGAVIVGNPFRGIFIAGAAGSGKSESVAVPLLYEFIRKGFSGVVYDFKYPALDNDITAFINATGSDLRHFRLNFNDPYRTDFVNPIKPEYVPNTSYAREYAVSIVANLTKESISNPDFWSRSATDVLTACIWYLREEHPEICDIPHVLAMVGSNGTALLNTLQKNIITEQMVRSVYDALQRGADNQVSGVLGTLQGAVAQINTPEMMWVFSRDGCPLDLNNPAAPAVLTVATNPTTVQTLSPLCSLVITVATKLMNQPGKAPSFVLLDEAPTIFIPNLETIPNTGRSNKIATVLMCQDLAQLADGYGDKKADVLFAACNSHFYGRVASSKTAEVFSRQFGKTDTVFVTSSENKNTVSPFKTKGQSEGVQERDIYRPSVFMELQVGEFIGRTVESATPVFHSHFKQVDSRYRQPVTGQPERFVLGSDVMDYYKQVREDIKGILGQP
jgi:type IV secretory pathway TraG/TraD family ATPase VirD4